jgi:hypothetical protein
MSSNKRGELYFKSSLPIFEAPQQEAQNEQTIKERE